MKRRGIVSGLTMTALLLTPTATGAISIRAAGKQYAKDVASANLALKAFDSEINSWTNATVDSQGEHQAAPVLIALRTLQRNLLSQTWPQSVRGSVRFICHEDISSLEEDLRMIDGNSSLGNGAFQITFRADTRTINLHAFYVRVDLGLPRSGDL